MESNLIHRLVSPFILEQFASGQKSGDLTAASLFVDISGFSQITYALMAQGQHGAELLARIMRQLFDPLVEAVYAHGGFITVFAGDAFTALFPVDESTDADWPMAVQQALAAGWRIREAVVASPPYDTGVGLFDVGVKVGLAMGDCHWQIVQAEEGERATFYFRGTAVDRAANAEKDAHKNWLVLTPDAAALVADQINTIPAGDHLRLLQVTADLPPAHPIDLPDVDPDVLAVFFPLDVTEAAHSGEFRQVINLFISLSGGLRDEQVVQFAQTLLALQGIYGGLLNRIEFGDKGCTALLFWGAPTAYENDVARALNFILALQEQSPLSLRAGLTQQIAHAGVIGSALQGEFTCYGNGVNLAARLMMKAPWGEIWVDEPLAVKGEQTFELSPLGAHSVKGFAQAQIVYRLKEEKSIAARFYEHEMVGRRHEAAQVRAFIEPILTADAEKRFGGILVVRGKAGMGKSRLVSAVQVEMEAVSDIQFALCQTDQIQRTPFNPFTYWLGRYFNQSAAQSVTRNKRAFNHKLDQLLAVTTDETLAKTLTQGRASLGSLIDLRWDNSAYEQLPPQGKHEWRTSTLKALLLAESRRRPLVILIEDVHWLDRESVAFIERLVRRIDAYPLAILATARPTVGDKPLFGQVDYGHLDLTVVNETEMVQLVSSVLDGTLTEPVARRIIDRAEGNPFFGKQIGLYLREQGTIAANEGQWQLAASDNNQFLPQDIRTIFTARLDQLTTELKQVVQTAAVLGREFEVTVLAQMLGSKLAIDPHLRQAAEVDIWSMITQLKYSFNHLMLRDAAYQMQLRARRRELHRLAAESLVILYPKPTIEQQGVIAYHYEQAYQLGETTLVTAVVDALQSAGQASEASGDLSKALDFFSRALAILPEKADRYPLLLQREGIYFLLGDREGQTADLNELETSTAGQPARQVEVKLRQARLASLMSNYPTAISLAQAAIALAQEAGLIGQEATAYVVLGRCVRHTGDYSAAREHLVSARTLAEAVGEQQVIGTVLNEFGILASLQGSYETARDYLEQARVIRQKIGDRQGLSDSLNDLGVVANNQGAYDVALDYHQQALAIMQEIGDRAGAAHSLTSQGYLVMQYGEHETAKDYFKQAMAIRQEIGDRQAVALSLLAIGDIFITSEEYEAARDYYQQALAINQELEYPAGVAISLHHLGNVAFAQQAYEVAREHLQQALAINQELDHPRWIALNLDRLGDVACAQERYDVAGDYHQQALATFQEIGSRRGVAGALEGLGDVARYQGAHDVAKDYFVQALPIYQEIGVMHGVAAILLRLGNVAFVQEEYKVAADHYEQALTVAEKIESRDHLLAYALTGLAVSRGRQSQEAEVLALAERAITLRQTLDQEALVMESRAVLAELWLRQGTLAAALAEVEIILAYLDAGNDFKDTEYLLRNRWVCYQVLQVQADPRAEAVLQAAYARLQARVAKMQDAGSREVILSQVPWHRAIVAAYEEWDGKAAKPISSAPLETDPAATPTAAPRLEHKPVNDDRNRSSAPVFPTPSSPIPVPTTDTTPPSKPAAHPIRSAQPTKRKKKKKKGKGKKKKKQTQKPLVINIHFDIGTIENINIDNLTLEQLQQLLAVLQQKDDEI